MKEKILIGMALIGLGLVGCSDRDNPVRMQGEAGNTEEAGPQIVAISPVSGQNYIAVDQPFAVEFSQAMDQASVEEAFQITVAQKPVTGKYTWNNRGTAMAFQPDVPFSPNTEINVNFGMGMRGRWGRPVVNQNGQPLGNFGFGCMTYGYPAVYESNGEQIYFTATSASGQPITFTMGSYGPAVGQTGYGNYPGYGPMMGGYGMGRGMMGSGWGNMGWSGQMGMSCASCHGPDGRGGRFLAMGTVQTPDIRYATLAGLEEIDGNAHEEGEEEHGHEAYDEESLKRVITQGIEPDGEVLNPFMPRWSMTDGDLDDLIEFLKTL